MTDHTWLDMLACSRQGSRSRHQAVPTGRNVFLQSDQIVMKRRKRHKKHKTSGTTPDLGSKKCICIKLNFNYGKAVCFGPRSFMVSTATADEPSAWNTLCVSHQLKLSGQDLSEEKLPCLQMIDTLPIYFYERWCVCVYIYTVFTVSLTWNLPVFVLEIQNTSSVEPAKQKATFGATCIWAARAAIKAGRSLFAFSGGWWENRGC